MKATIAQKAKIGVFTLTGIVLLAAGIFLIGEKRNMFGRTFTIYGTFKNIGGLQSGSNVRFAGIDIGTVISITILNDSSIKVGMRLKEKVHPFLKSDAVASIGSDGLMGDKLVNISPGPVGDKPIEKHGMIATQAPIEFDRIISRISKVADNAESITSSLADMATHINSGKGSIGHLIYSDSLARSLESTVHSARETVTSARKGAEGFKENMDAMKHNFLLKGYFKKKAKKEKQHVEDSTRNAQQ